MANTDTWDSNALHFTVQRYPRKEYCRMVRETLAGMREKEEQANRDKDRLARIYAQVMICHYSCAVMDHGVSV